jgi:hypothetical protein
MEMFNLWEEWSASNNISMSDLMMTFGLGSDSRWFEQGTETALVTAFCLVIVLGVVGNALVAFLLCRRCRLRRSPRHW